MPWMSDRIALLEAIAAAARLLPDQVGWFTEDEVVCAACGTSTPPKWEIMPVESQALFDATRALVALTTDGGA